ncbi:hypothetical protein AURDEDRAFT_114191 [Auricularia subglabra TFB-10046 SS5]|nr:hypothetical protein AURDEDRAFT_114191 [Auricularia subglabra TFB-10046 SS5]
MTSLLDDTDAFASILTCATPLLGGLELNLGAPLGNLRDILPNAPNLREVDTTHPFSDGARKFPKVAVARLISPITADALRRDDIAILQRACPELADLTLIKPRLGPCIRLEPCALNVPRLNLSYSRGDGDLLEFAGQFSLPHIRFLKLYGNAEGSSARLGFLDTVLPQWKSLNKLVISTILAADFDAFCVALVHGENLGSLTIRKVDFTHGALRKLCDTLGRPRDDGGAWVCPQLKSLEMSTCSLARDCVADDLVLMVARRLAASDKTGDERCPARLRGIWLPKTSEIGLVARVRDLFSANDD